MQPETGESSVGYRRGSHLHVLREGGVRHPNVHDPWKSNEVKHEDFMIFSSVISPVSSSTPLETDTQK